MLGLLPEGGRQHDLPQAFILIFFFGRRVGYRPERRRQAALGLNMMSLAAKPSYLRYYPSTVTDIALILRGQANACVELLRQPQGGDTGSATESNSIV